MNLSLINLRAIKVLLILFLTISMFISFSAKADEKEAANFINDLASRVIGIVKREDLSEATKETKLNEIFFRSVDTKWIGRFSLGRYWRVITPEQQKEFLDVYSKYLAGLYVPNFRKYTGDVIKVTNSKEIRPNEYFVQTLLISGTNKAGNIQINYMIKQDSKGIEKFIIFDIIAEGVSLITTQRAELGSVMADNGFNKMMSLLRKKTP
ncbi:MAG: ABC transporter substrate-binding protein [Rickettsiales bacterium]|jgi:phospholipid transport system substrate-binding protein|nr:ABC transporter substrate-binding protein [Rickettsiales bacterium]